MAVNMIFYDVLDNRGVVAVEGPDARSFLQAMISNDANNISPSNSIYAAMLTPQGKYLHDFVISQVEDRFLLETEQDRMLDLVNRLNLFRLGAEVTITAIEGDSLIAAFWGKTSPLRIANDHQPGYTTTISNCCVVLDPRLAALGYRVMGTKLNIEKFINHLSPDPVTKADFDSHRLEIGVPDGSRDIRVNKSFLLESNFEELNGVAFDKGCYVGQENTARQKHKGTIRRRLIKVNISGPPPVNNERISWKNGEIGEMRSVRDDAGMAIIRLDRWAEAKAQNAEFRAGSAIVVPVLPEWINLEDM
jgi:folate-binding protein YgfZ